MKTETKNKSGNFIKASDKTVEKWTAKRKAEILTERTQGEWKINKQGEGIFIYSLERRKAIALLYDVAEANADFICKAVNNHEELFQMVIDLKNCIKRLTQDDLSQHEKDTEAQWEGEAYELLIRINPNYYRNANETDQ